MKNPGKVVLQSGRNGLINPWVLTHSILIPKRFFSSFPTPAWVGVPTEANLWKSTSACSGICRPDVGRCEMLMAFLFPPFQEQEARGRLWGGRGDDQQDRHRERGRRGRRQGQRVRGVGVGRCRVADFEEGGGGAETTKLRPFDQFAYTRPCSISYILFENQQPDRQELRPAR